MIGQTIAEKWRFLRFFKMAAVPPSHHSFRMCLDHWRTTLCGLYHCAKFGWNRFSNFDNMQVLVFCKLGLKIPTDAPKMGVLRDLIPKLGTGSS